jgi:hypothetical protein
VIDPELIVEAELIDPGPQMPPPGIVHGVALMHYRVLRVLEGEYAHADLYAAHDGADLSAPAFQPGARHRLYLTRSFPEDVSVLGLDKAGDRGAYFCPRYELLG